MAEWERMDLGQGIPGLASKREYAGHAVGDLFFVLQRFNMFFKSYDLVYSYEKYSFY